MAKRRYDRYDYIGFGLLACIAALWVAHFVMPDRAPPPPP